MSISGIVRFFINNKKSNNPAKQNRTEQQNTVKKTQSRA